MKNSNSGNERFYRDRLKVEVAAENAHKRLFRKHKAAFNQFFDLASKHGESHVRENHPDLAKSVDLVYASTEKLNEVRSDDQARRAALLESLIAEMKAMASADTQGGDPIVRLREDFRALSAFRAKYLDGVNVDFWLFNALSSVGLGAKAWLSGPVVKAWCEVKSVDPDMIVAALSIVSPLWKKEVGTSQDNASTVMSRVDDYPYDIDELLLNARNWWEADRGAVEILVAAREAAPAGPSI